MTKLSGAFAYRSGVLCVEDVAVDKIAAEVGTPVYIYSEAQIKANYKAFTAPFEGVKATPFYAVKANANYAVIATLAACGAGADVTSAGELERAMNAGVPAHKIMYSGVGKTHAEIALALKSGIYQFNVESMPELRRIDEVAAQAGKKAPVALRVNPDVAARTHKKTSTGELGTKFGIDLVQLDEAMALVASLKNIEFKGFQVHIGSHVYDYEPFREAFRKMADLVQSWRAKGFTITRLNLGGGVGIPYDGQTLAPLSDYTDIVLETVGNIGCELLFEPGRRFVGDAGILVSQVTYDKQGANKRFLILDAGMNDLVRPAMYDARHSIVPVREAKKADEANTQLADVVGPVCETSDLFGEDYLLPGVGQGDLIAILQAGAYSASMSSNYNGRPLIPEVMVSGNQFAVVRRRVSITEQIGWESSVPWAKLAKAG